MKNRKRSVARLIMTIFTVCAVGAIFFNSSLDANESTGQSDPLVDSINEFLRCLRLSFTVDSHMVRKAAHFTEYTILGVLLSVTLFLYLSKRLKTFLITLPVGLAVAVCDELIQLFPAGRSCEVKDMAIDFSGVLFGALTVQLIMYLIFIHRVKKEGNEIERSKAE